MRANDYGLPSETWVSVHSTVHPNTLANWRKNKPRIYHLIMLGMVAEQHAQELDNLAGVELPRQPGSPASPDNQKCTPVYGA